MSRYRKIHARMWGDEKFRSVSSAPPNAQTLWLYLLTGPHTTVIPGVAMIGEAALAEGLGWPLKGFREAFLELSQKGMAKADWRARVVVLPNACRYNPPESPNVVKAWRKAFDELPECPLVLQAFHSVRAFLKDLPHAFSEVFGQDLREGYGKVMGESVTGTVTRTGSPPTPPQGDGQAKEWIELLNRLTGRQFECGEQYLRHIRTRQRAGRTLAEAGTVIRDRITRWGQDAEKREWLRPETLFGSKFDTYLALATRPEIKRRDGQPNPSPPPPEEHHDGRR